MKVALPTRQPKDTTPAASPASDASGPAPAYVNSPIRTRQPRWVWLAGIALIVIAILGAVWLVNNLRQTTSVLVLNNTVQQGQPISADDLKIATINTDSGISAVPDTQRAQVEGKVAAVTLTAGSILNPKDVTVGLIPGDNQSLIGITVAVHKMPAEPLVAGDLIRLVDTPRDQDDSPAQGPITSKAQVISTRFIPELRQTTIDVLVPHDEASWVSARAATHRVAVILDSRKR